VAARCDPSIERAAAASRHAVAGVSVGVSGVTSAQDGQIARAGVEAVAK
jgi:uncharacterized protein GlcG (DUF336 family)